MLTFTLEEFYSDDAKRAILAFDAKTAKAGDIASKAAQAREAITLAKDGGSALKHASEAKALEFDSIQARLAALTFGRDETLAALVAMARDLDAAERQKRAELRAEHVQALTTQFLTRMKAVEIRRLATRKPSKAMEIHRKVARENVRVLKQRIDTFAKQIETGLAVATAELERLAATM